MRPSVPSVGIWATLDMYNIEQYSTDFSATGTISQCLIQALISLKGSTLNNKVSLPLSTKFYYLFGANELACEGYACKGAQKVNRVTFLMRVPAEKWLPGAAARLARVVNNGHLQANMTKTLIDEKGASVCGFTNVVIPPGGLNLYQSPPTPMPTSKPSISFTPTSFPSNQPSGCPSTEPSTQPSMLPSVQPTAQPSGEPSTQPSMQPSVQPSAEPTMQPSNQPTRQPIRHPTGQPSRIPTSQPSKQPTRQPTRRPSHEPSRFSGKNSYHVPIMNL